MLAAALMLVVAQAPRPVTLMEGGWVGADVDASQVSLWNEVLFAELSHRGITVRTQADVAQVLGVERQKQLLGCSEEASCTAEIAAALDADGIIRGSVGKAGSSLVVNVRVLSPVGEPLAVHSAVVSSIDAALKEMKPIADALAVALAAKFPRQLTVKPGYRKLAWAPGVAAIAFLGAGVGLQVGGRGLVEKVRTRSEPYPGGLAAVDADLSAAGTMQTLSFVGFGVGAAAAAGAVVLWLTGNDAVQARQVLLVPAPGGLALVGRWP